MLNDISKEESAIIVYPHPPAEMEGSFDDTGVRARHLAIAYIEDYNAQFDQSLSTVAPDESDDSF